MKHKRSSQNSSILVKKNSQLMFQIDQINPLAEIDRNLIVSGTNKASFHFSKRSFHFNKALTTKINKLPLDVNHYDENCIRKYDKSIEFKPFGHSKKTSNIQILKKQIQYLNQEQLDSQQFPKRDTLVHDQQKSIDTKLKESLDLYCSRAKMTKALSTFTKGFIGCPVKTPFAHSTQKFQRKFLKSKDKDKIKKKKDNGDKDKQNKFEKTFFKYELIAPYRKYFQANRFKKNKSCSMKVDQILGKRLTMLSNFTLQDDL